MKTGTRVRILALIVPAMAAVPAGASEELRDPTRPLDAIDAPTEVIIQKMDLKAIITKPGSSIAFINGRAVKDGDTVNGVTITRIESDRVYYNGEESGVLLLYPEIIKKKPLRDSDR